MSEAAAKKDIQKLQRAIVDGLEDVKAHDIRVFNTEQLTPLFERVIVASGTSNRQTKALAASVRDKVREAGLAKPRIEGEENGEWIVVDCGAAVAHIMQPTIRQYYNLEEIWGAKPVRLKGPASKAAAKKSKEKDAPAPAKKATAAAKKEAIAKKPAAKTPARKTAAKSPARKAAAPRAGSGRSRGGASASLQTVVVNKPSTRGAAKTAVKTMAKAPAKTAARTAGRAPAKSAAKPMTKPAAKKAAPRSGR
ncbi:ribosome silencing factor [Ottowia testudinis]|uniref:Ribosomal silencing factor RsfS n=1 Tax=Ottowia testudinis TaxID=2816950 RepID=A0A975CHS6_9BURK|nr:ribosome silencing factor [Ottowia testudinis]QTD46673.1 ribosome silencing factor [Ottowia testudinis]